MALNSTEQIPLVSVCMITYKHAAFIAQAIESILAQQTNFEFELRIHDDCSPDETAAVVAQLAQSHPKGYRIHYHRRTPNVGVMPNFFGLLESSSAKYIAVCEGDDYWADVTKLQQQIDFLEAHPEVVLTCHDAHDVDVNGTVLPSKRLKPDQQRDFTAQELREGAYVLTLTMCFRNVIRRFPKEVYDVYNGDLFLTILLGDHGSCTFMHSIAPACYRLHEAGVWSLKTKAFRFQKAASSYLTIARYFKRMNNIGLQRHYLRWYTERNEEVYGLLKADGAAAEAKAYLSECLAHLAKEDAFSYRIAQQRWQRIRFAENPLGKFLVRIKKIIRG